MSIVIDNISYCVKNRQILENINFKINPGELVSIMGPSGSGKTSLLNILGDRIKENVLGKVTINGKKPNRKNIGFVLQDDIMFPNLTIKQTLLFTANMRRPDLNKSEKYNLVTKLADLLGLSNVLDSYIGNENKRGISGGEKRRVNICNELISSPRILFLDEPTSGLDTPTAIHLIKILKNLAESGTTVIFSIHQPPSQTYPLFDKLMFLVNGCLIYTGKPLDIKNYITGQDIKYSRHSNPADHLMQLILDDKSDSLKQNLINNWKLNICSDPENIQIIDTNIPLNKKLNSFSQILYLTKRAFLQNFLTYIDPVDNIILIILCIFLSSIWFQKLQNNSSIDISNNIIFSLIAIIALKPAFSALSNFTNEHTIISRELDTGSYYFFTYYISKTICEIPYLLLQPTIYILIFYFMVGFKLELLAFIFTYITLNTYVFCLNSIGLAVSIISKNIDQAEKIVGYILIFSNFLSGFWIKYFPIGIKWLQYILPTGYAYQALLLNEFENKIYTNNGTIQYGKEFLKNQDIWFSNKWYYFLILMFMNIFYRIIAGIFLKLSFRKKKLLYCFN